MWTEVVNNSACVPLLHLSFQATGTEFYTEWFKINLALFKSHISHKWEIIIDLFEDIYKA